MNNSVLPNFGFWLRAKKALVQLFAGTGFFAAVPVNLRSLHRGGLSEHLRPDQSQ